VTILLLLDQVLNFPLSIYTVLLVARDLDSALASGLTGADARVLLRHEDFGSCLGSDTLECLALLAND